MELIVEGLQVTVLGMGVVFVVLYLLSVILRLFASVFYQKNLKPITPASKLPENTKNRVIEEEELESDMLLISIIMAQLLAGNEYNLNIKQIS